MKTSMWVGGRLTTSLRLKKLSLSAAEACRHERKCG